MLSITSKSAIALTKGFIASFAVQIAAWATVLSLGELSHFLGHVAGVTLQHLLGW
jgi:hypothetical protein